MIAEDNAQFEATVREVMQRDKVPFILALYQVVDEMTAQGVRDEEVKPACHAGCSFCCHQLVVCTDLEWAAIKSFLESLPAKQRYAMSRRIKCLMKSWRQYWQKHSRAIRLSLRKPLTDWHGQPCPFLGDDQTCIIYPVRPIDCRTMSSTIVCTRWDTMPGVKRLRFTWERRANNWILEEEARIQGKDLRSIEIYLILDRLSQNSKLWS